MLVGLAPSVILTYLAFVQTRDALTGEVEKSLQAEAASVSARIDYLLFERLQNALGWSRLEVMQDIRINDVDKRLSQFLAEVKASYGDIYLDLYCADLSGRILASSAASLIGRRAESPGTPLQVVLPNGTVEVDSAHGWGEEGRRVLPLRAGIASSSDGAPIGELVLLLDWRQIGRILDGVESEGRMAQLLDAGGHGLDVSASLRQRADAEPSRAADWAVPAGRTSGTLTQPSAWLAPGALMVGYRRAGGFGRFSGLGWTTLVMQPSVTALAVVQRMRLVFAALLLGSLLLTFAFAIYVAGRIARPITRLTAFTRRFALEQRLPPSPERGSGEVGELTDTFIDTVHALDRSRQDLLRASKLAVAGEIAATMAHEIRTPLGVLRSSAQVLRGEPALSPEGRELVGYIESETERINRLMTTVLDSAKPHPPALKPHDIGPLVHRCVVMLTPQADRKSVTLHESAAPGPLVADCDEEQIVQVLLNLLLNAIQMVPDAGRVEIGCHDDGNGIRIEVSDDGPGIEPSERAGIFEPFVSRRRGGLGLGLSVVRQIVLAHRGEISVGTGRLGGALFTILLPHGATS
jgi:signal transduction histidine kinase